MKLFRKRALDAGLPPGTLVHVGEKTSAPVRIRVIDYDEEHFQEKEAKDVAECFPYRETPTVTWINIDGIYDPKIIEQVGTHFRVHPLILEDVMNTAQRPKMDDQGEYIYVAVKELGYDERTDEIRVDHISLFVGPNFVLSFQETPGDPFDAIRDRLRQNKGRIRKMGPDYLAYALIDAVVDYYFVLLDKIGQNIERLEEEVLSRPDARVMHRIHRLRSEMLFLRKSVWPLREVISALERSESKLIRRETGLYLKDVYEHTVQVNETVETYRDLLGGLLEIYMSSVNNRMNETVKVLTLISTFFIPMTFVAGVYGMNFQILPEVHWAYGYAFFWAIIVGIALCMLIFFKKRKWL